MISPELRDRSYPSTTVVIPAHNAAMTIGAQLQALTDQVGDVEFDVVVVLNRCTDSTSDEVHRYGSQLSVRTLRADERSGATYARNVGVRSTSSDVVLHCDADDVVGNSWVSEMVRALGEADLVGGRLVPPNDLRDVWYLDPDQYSHDGLARSRGVLYPLGCSMGYRREVFDAVGGFDESLLIGGEEIAFSLMAQRLGFRVCPVPRAVTVYNPRRDRRGLLRQRANYWRSEFHMRCAHTPEQVRSPKRELAASMSLAALFTAGSLSRDPLLRRKNLIRAAQSLGRMQGQLQVLKAGTWPKRSKLKLKSS